MVQRTDNKYTTYVFTEVERQAAIVFTDLQYMHIQTELGIWAEAQTNIAYNPESPNADREFIIQREYHRGCITALQLLLRMSDEEKDRLQEQLRQQMQNQQSESQREGE